MPKSRKSTWIESQPGDGDASGQSLINVNEDLRNAPDHSMDEHNHGKSYCMDQSLTKISDRARQNITQEISRCLALIRRGDSPLSSMVWLPQLPDPVTRRSLPPILNEESRITGAADLRADKSRAAPAVLQVINTWTNITPSSVQVQDPALTNGASGASNFPQSSGVLQSDERKKKADSAFIPLFPKDISSVIRHWIMKSPSEGVNKALVQFSSDERNCTSSQKKLYSKRRSVSLAFLHYVDLHGVSDYEKEFCALREPFKYSRIQKKSSEFLARRRAQVGGKLDSDSDMALFTDGVCRRLNLRQKLCFRK